MNADAGMLTPSNQQQPSVLSPASSASRSAEQQQRSKTDAHTPPLSSSHERRELEATMRRQRVGSLDTAASARLHLRLLSRGHACLRTGAYQPQYRPA